MKISYFAIGLLSLLAPLTAAWSKEDREIFRIRDEIAAHETDPSATFYDILGVSPSASLDDITKALRKLSRSTHPDKVKQQLRADAALRARKSAAAAGGSKAAPAKQPSAAEIRKAVKEASERQTRLSLIAEILRGPARDRYDHFLSNGFPLWKGTDYYYNRYRPGLGTVMMGLFFVVGGGIHYLTLYMSWKRQKEFVERYITFARNAAWGNSAGIPNLEALAAANAAAAAAAATPDESEAEASEAGPPQPMNRKQRRFQEKESRKEEGRAPKKTRRAALQASKNASREQSVSRPAGVRKRVVAQNGKILVVDSQGNVYLEGEDEDGNVNEYLLDPNELVQPTFRDTAVVRVPIWFYQKSVGRFLPNKAPAAEGQTEGEAEIVETEIEAEDAAQTVASSDSAGDDFEMVDQNAEMVAKAKTSGAQQGGKASKRKTKKR